MVRNAQWTNSFRSGGLCQSEEDVRTPQDRGRSSSLREKPKTQSITAGKTRILKHGELETQSLNAGNTESQSKRLLEMYRGHLQ